MWIVECVSACVIHLGIKLESYLWFISNPSSLLNWQNPLPKTLNCFLPTSIARPFPRVGIDMTQHVASHWYVAYSSNKKENKPIVVNVILIQLSQLWTLNFLCRSSLLVISRHSFGLTLMLLCLRRYRWLVLFVTTV